MAKRRLSDGVRRPRPFARQAMIRLDRAALVESSRNSSGGRLDRGEGAQVVGMAELQDGAEPCVGDEHEPRHASPIYLLEPYAHRLSGVDATYHNRFLSIGQNKLEAEGRCRLATCLQFTPARCKRPASARKQPLVHACHNAPCIELKSWPSTDHRFEVLRHVMHSPLKPKPVD